MPLPNPLFTKPCTEEDLEELKAVFRSIPSYVEEDGGWIKSTDVGGFWNSVGHTRTPEQYATYTRYWDEHFGGKCLLDRILEFARAMHDPVSVARICANTADKNGDGEISEQEFVTLLEILISHNPELTGTSYKDFQSKADTDLDGRVSIDECVAWIESRATNLKL